MVTQQEIDAILSDGTKVISKNIVWKNDHDRSPAQVFRVEVDSAPGHPIFINGWFNPSSGKLSFAIIYRGIGRIYGLDLGADHRNPDGDHLGEKHKHQWRQGAGDKWAYVPADITEPWSRPIEVWEQFCLEANLRHSGMTRHPETQFDLPL